MTENRREIHFWLTDYYNENQMSLSEEQNIKQQTNLHYYDFLLLLN